MATYYWEETLNVYCRINPSDAARIAGSKLLNEEFSVQEAGERILMQITKANPDLVMEQIGRLLFDKKEAWRLQIRGCLSLLVSVPPESVMAWLAKTGIEEIGRA